MMDISEALRARIESSVADALVEDIGGGDVSAALISPAAEARGVVVARQDGVFCGQPWVEEVARQMGGAFEADWHVRDGADLNAGQALFELHGQARAVLTAERTVLNFVQLLSGTATRTRHFVRLLEGTGCQLLDTRKTLPGLRLAQKYAVRCGGGTNHRLGLYDAYLIKENHIAAAGSIGAAVTEARKRQSGLPVEVEVESLTELGEALAAAADTIMLDNFSIAETKQAVALTGGGARLEASGGIDESQIRAIAETGVDCISVGALTKDVAPLDLSMRFSL
ncbi:MAG: carboxylating nicotinate-nucleotide diphosphorylase [Gammaproteobacteria bacterium]|nr:carboxylating nicotinate-nucleotide diphosphorylase [Gammaproteobacteria bacterium]